MSHPPYITIYAARGIMDTIFRIVAVTLLGSVAMSWGMVRWTVLGGRSGFWMIARFPKPTPTAPLVEAQPKGKRSDYSLLSASTVFIARMYAGISHHR